MDDSTETAAIEAIRHAAVARAAGSGRRDAHPKAHGCVTAKFIVDASRLVKEAQVGVFSKPRTFDAWIRFSNAASTPGSDTMPDVRGMAIKLMGVEGKKLLAHERGAKTQDFILMSHEVFFARNPEELLMIVRLVDDDPAVESRRAEFAQQLAILEASQKSAIKNPLAGTYWSTVPFRLGPHSMKYRTVCSVPVPEPANLSSADFMQVAMKAHLDHKEARFVFYVQLHQDEATTPIEDPTVPWRTEFIPVATIIIPPQDFTSNARKEFCENLSFTPWHSLTEHEPLGAINRARRSIYEAVSAERHKFNNVPGREPVG
jgi:hypothetical protein